MRAGLGLLSILIAVGIIFYVAFGGPGGGYVPTVIKSGNVAQSQANQLAGKDENDIAAKDSIALVEDNPSGNNLRGLIVKQILPGGPMQTVYSLAVGDEITATGPMRVRDQNDAELAKDMVFDAFARNWPLTITRNGQELTLNPDSALTAAHPNMFAAPGATPTGNNVPQNGPSH
jgi:hypothetical protein